VATWQDLVNGALFDIGRLQPGDSPTTAENTLYLQILNDMIDQFTNELGPIYAETLDILTWTGGQATRTIGTGGDFNISRPQRILSAWYRFQSVNDYALKVITHQEYEQIVIKSLSVDFPQYLAYNPTFPTGTLYIWPIPQANATIRLNSWKPLSSVAALSDTVSLPPGYNELIKYNFEIRVGPGNGGLVDPMIVELANQAKFKVARANEVIEPADMDPMAPGQSKAVDYIRLYTQT
jgi:hypothetical protein